MRVIFCGVGAIGSNAAVLCRNMPATLRFIDFDRVESKNLLAQAYVKQSIGKNKADALRLQLLNLYGIRAEAHGVRLVTENVRELCSDGDLLVDAFDNHASRVLLSEFARSVGKPLVHGALAADGTFGLVRWDERFTPDAEDAEGQATCEDGAHLPMIGLVAAALVRAVQDFVQHGARRDVMISKSGVVTTA